MNILSGDEHSLFSTALLLDVQTLSKAIAIQRFEQMRAEHSVRQHDWVCRRGAGKPN
jgi:hypothetical protein